MNRALLLALSASAILTGVAHAAPATGIEVISKAGTLYAEPRALAATLRGHSVRGPGWVTLTSGAHHLKVFWSSGAGTLDGHPITLSTHPMRVSGRWVLPAADIAAAFGKDLHIALSTVLPQWPANTAFGASAAPSAPTPTPGTAPAAPSSP